MKENPPVYPRVLQVLPTLESGGVERGTLEIARALKQAGFKAPLVASAGGAMVAELEQMGVEHITLPLDTKNPFGILRNAAALREFIQAYGVDIVHARSRAPAWSAWLAARHMDCHFITTFHGTYGRSPAIFKPWYNSVMTKGERVIAISDFIRDHIHNYHAVEPSRIRTIPRGVDLHYFDPQRVTSAEVSAFKQQHNLTESWPVVVMPARVTRWKGHLFLLRALQQLPREVKFYCLLVGKPEARGNYTQEILNFIVEHQMGKQVKMLPTQANMALVYAAADVVVSASQQPEAFGRVAIEAQAMGKPIIATNIGGSRETVVHGVTGWLVDSVMTSDMTHALQQALTLENIQKYDIARKAHAHVQQHFSAQQMCDATLTLYQDVMHGK